MHNGSAIAVSLKPWLNENAKNITADNSPSRDHITIMLNHKYVTIALPLQNLRLRMKILKKLHRSWWI